jgi:hypothetical protein
VLSKACLELSIDNFLAHVAAWTPRWFNKPKFHILLHLPSHIRRFGPAILFATEGFESYNKVIRGKSIHSNCQAPSHDISMAFAHSNRVCYLTSGGPVLEKEDLLQTTTPQTYHIGQQPVGHGPATVLKDSTIASYLGLNPSSHITAGRFYMVFDLAHS